MSMANALGNGYNRLSQFLDRFVEPLAMVLVRFTVGNVFLDSGLTKWTGFLSFNEEKYDLFLYEFFCPDPVRPGALLLCDPNTLDYADGAFVVKVIEILAVAAGVIEVALPILLIFGLLTRFAALGLLGMTMFIQLAVFPTWDHWVNPASWWAITLLVILARGPGWMSLDRLLKIDGLKRHY